MKKVLLTFWLFFHFNFGFAQGIDLSVWDNAVLESASVHDSIKWLSLEEKKAIFYINLVRMNPKLFKSSILKPYLDSIEKKENKWTKSMENELSKLKPLPPMLLRKDLTECAVKHAVSMGKVGKMGHNSPDGGNLQKRLKHLKSAYSIFAENCHYGCEEGLEAVIDLLIDENVVGEGHRKNILHKNLKYVGVAIRPHIKTRYNCVMVFGGIRAIMKAPF